MADIPLGERPFIGAVLVAVPGEVSRSPVLSLCSLVFSGIHNPVIYPVAAILPGRWPISGAVSSCSLWPGFRGVWLSGLFPGYSGTYNPAFRLEAATPTGRRLITGTDFRFRSTADILRCPVPRLSRNPNPSVPTRSRHPYGETANHQRGFRLQSPADVTRSPDPRPFSQLSQNPQPAFRAETAIPPGRRPISGTGFRLQSPVDVPRYPVPRHFSLTFPRTHNPLFQPEAATPPGRRPTIGTAFLLLTRPFPDLAIPPAMPRAKRPRSI